MHSILLTAGSVRSRNTIHDSVTLKAETKKLDDLTAAQHSNSTAIMSKLIFRTFVRNISDALAMKKYKSYKVHKALARVR